MTRSSTSRYLTAALLAIIAVAPGFALEECPTEPTVPPGVTRGRKALAGGKMRYWPERADQAETVTATFVGGPGHEFLVDGGFQRDGTVVVVGNVLGGVFDPGVPVAVLGPDGDRPPAIPMPVDGKSREHLSWRNSKATGFIALCERDMAGLRLVSRLPWLAGAITAVEIGSDDSIYIAGRAGVEIERLGLTMVSVGHDAIPVSQEAERRKGECTRTFVARLSPDARLVEWVRTSEGWSDAPRLSLAAGTLGFYAQELVSLDPAGKVVNTVTIRGGVRPSTSVSPVDGSIVRGGEHHWPTGRQPWRCPTLWINRPDGTPRYQLYDWGGPYVVLDDLFLVSDTAVQMVTHDRQGNIMLVLWSDGGNSVAYRQPNDVRSHIGTRGCGCSSHGAGATSFAYLARLEPKDYRVSGFTLWCAQYGPIGKGNGASVEAICEVADGSFAFGGESAWGLVQTPNKLANGEPGGAYVAVLTPDLRGVRFSSCVPGAGVAQVGYGKARWGIASGVVEGKSRVLFLGGAQKEGNVYELVTQTPVRHAMQPAFGGGLCDGYAVLLDLSAPVVTDPKAPLLPAAPQRIAVENYGWRKGKRSRRATVPKEGEIYHFRPDHPRWTTCDAEVRDRQGTMWPSFCYGKPVSGRLTWKDGGPEGAFEVALTKWCQPNGDQDRRVLGSLLTKAPAELPPLVFRITSFGRLEQRTMTRQRKGRPVEVVVPVCKAKAEVEIAGTKAPVTADCVVWTGLVHESDIRMTQVQAIFTVKGRSLGLMGAAAELDLDVRIGVQGHADR